MTVIVTDSKPCTTHGVMEGKDCPCVGKPIPKKRSTAQ